MRPPLPKRLCYIHRLSSTHALRLQGSHRRRNLDTNDIKPRDLLGASWRRNIREAREHRTWSQEQVALAAGTSWQSVSNRVRGLSRPTAENQALLAGLLRLSVPMLFPIHPASLRLYPEVAA